MRGAGSVFPRPRQHQVRVESAANSGAKASMIFCGSGAQLRVGDDAELHAAAVAQDGYPQPTSPDCGTQNMHCVTRDPHR